jgi:hypothetical protein
MSSHPTGESCFDVGWSAYSQRPCCEDTAREDMEGEESDGGRALQLNLTVCS